MSANLTVEMRDKINNYFVTTTEDKFTKTCQKDSNKTFIWKHHNYNISMNLIYSKNNNEELIVLQIKTEFAKNICGLNNITVYLLLNNNLTIEVNEVIKYDYAEDERRYEYSEFVLLSIPIPDLISIVNSDKMEMSMRFERDRFDYSFNESEMTLIKGFYNNVLDNNFAIELLAKYIEADEEYKRKWDETFNKEIPELPKKGKHNGIWGRKSS